jgi:uracil-DNA glycosylase
MRPLAVEQLFKRLPADYQELLHSFFENPNNWSLLEKLVISEHQERLRTSVYPDPDVVFNALYQTPLKDVKVVLIGQDPYHTPGLAHGLAFSVPEHLSPGSRSFPSSLRNISKALVLDGFAPLPHGYLIKWAQQGVLLLNTVLTVPVGQPQGHQKLPWNFLTDAIISELSKWHHHLVWLLWGKFAQKKIPLIDGQSGHYVLTASHPSGLGVYQTSEPFIFKGDQKSCGHFRKTNEWLTQHQKTPIDWSSSLFHLTE